jgi:predicted AAA+ superfamily ATPase
VAVSNRDRVSRAFDLFVEGAGPFVDQYMAASVPAGTPGDWTEVIARRDEQKFGRKPTISKADPQVIIRMILEEWRVFKDVLSRGHQNLAGLLKDFRNKLAHGDVFSGDETYRVLDTIELMLTAMGAVDQAETVRKSKVEHQRTVFADEVRKAAKTSTAQLVEGMGVKAWRDVIAPHEDVRSGNFNAAEFAASLYHVAHGEAGTDEYGEPVPFFRRTYLTEGLRDLLGRAVRRVSGDANASPVVNLQTNFGGGKTHSMLALYHIFSGRPLGEYPQEVQELLAGHDLTKLGQQVRRVVLVGNHLPASGLKAEGDKPAIKTMWGEMAWQLGGAAGYASVAQADADRTSPGAALTELIAAYAPCVILIDEWVAYARQLYNREDLDGGTFETQFTFAQTLTEAVAAVPGALLVVSIPASDDLNSTGASDLEVGGPNGQLALQRLQHVVRRVADTWRPATANESFEIVRRRLFDAPTGSALRDIAAVARTFTQFYHQHKGEFPNGCAEREYEDRIKAAYPIHPELFDRLYNDWSTLERFQRTRGVLQLMSKVIHALWVAGDAAPLVMPGSVPLDTSSTRDQLCQYLEDSWKPILDKDVDGPTSSPAAIDASRSAFGQRALTRRIARTIFMGSAPTLKSAHKGIDQQRIWLGVAVPGDVPGNFGSALHLLGDRATYLYGEGGRWWYDTQESVTRTARDLADRLRDKPEEAWATIVDRLRKRETRNPGDFVRVHAGFEATGDVPDDPEARLVILHPRFPHVRGSADSEAYSFARQALERCGSGQRVRRNMLVFLAPDSKRLTELDDAVRQYLAWKTIVDSKVERNLSPAQQKQADVRLADANRSVDLRIPETYIHLLAPAQHDPSRPPSWDEHRAEGDAGQGLATRASAKLRQLDLLRTEHGVRNIRLDLDDPKRLGSVWKAGHITVGELWTLYTKYPYLARLRSWSVLERSVRSTLDEIAWSQMGFALATGFDEQSGRYLGLAIPHEDSFGPIVETTLLVEATRAQRQRDLERAEQLVDQARAAGVEVEVEAAGVVRVVHPDETAGPTEPARPSRFFGVYRIDPNPVRRMKLLTDLDREVLQHLAADEDVELQISVEITATKPGGFADDKIRTVRENARALKFEQADFETD